MLESQGTHPGEPELGPLVPNADRQLAWILGSIIVSFPVFAIWPEMDIHVSRAFHEPTTGFAIEGNPLAEALRLTDTFQMYESDDLISHYMPDNSERRKRQKATDIRVIVGNPPYSSGQNSANDNNANTAYPHLDDRLRDTFVARSNSPN